MIEQRCCNNGQVNPLVACQVRVAAGEPIAFRALQGHGLGLADGPDHDTAARHGTRFAIFSSDPRTERLKKTHFRTDPQY